jgi:hypothetical protein
MKKELEKAKAMYHKNYNNGFSELYMNDTDEKIEVR